MDQMALDETVCWTAIEERDRMADGRLPMPRTTGVFAGRAVAAAGRGARTSPSIPCRRRQAGGFRACRRCRPEAVAVQDERVALVGRACRLIEASEDRAPSSPSWDAISASARSTCSG